MYSDKSENWDTSKIEVYLLAELKEKSGIETSILYSSGYIKASYSLPLRNQNFSLKSLPHSYL